MSRGLGDVYKRQERGEKVVLVRLETSPEDIEGMKASQGILTVRGGMTSHAAVVARGMGTCCVSGCSEIIMDEANKKFVLAGKEYHEGDWLSIDGSTGKIYDGVIPTVDATIAGEFGRIMAWADKYRRLKVRTNADTPRDAAKARELASVCPDPARKAQLLQIASNCDRVPERGATNFYEACQAFWFVQILLQIEANGHSISPGRFDQYMYPFLKADTGISKEFAQELVDCIWVKLNDVNLSLIHI